jgi:hypothetical protein
MPMYAAVVDDWSSRMASAIAAYEIAAPEDKDALALEVEAIAIEFKFKHTQRSFASVAENPAPPAVFAVSPSDGQINVNSAVSPTVTFTKPMFPASIVAASFQYSANGGAFASFNSVALNGDGTIATLTKSGGFSAGVTYRVRILASVCDTDGVSIGSNYTQNLGFVIAA